MTSGSMLWVKGRTPAYDTRIVDSIRGSTTRLLATSNAAEVTDSTGVTAFLSNGFSLGNAAGYNQSANDFVAWAFREYTGFFDVVTYTGTASAQNVAHSLGAVPQMMFVKRRNSSVDWRVYHAAMDTGGSPADYYQQLNGVTAKTLGSTVWDSTPPTSSVFRVGTATQTNVNGAPFLAYLFGALAGVSAAGLIDNNPTADQDINCGFTAGARFVLIKSINNSSGWMVFDTTRGIVAGSDPLLSLNSANAETATVDWVDYYAQGFRFNGTLGAATDYIYFAIA